MGRIYRGTANSGFRRETLGGNYDKGGSYSGDFYSHSEMTGGSNEPHMMNL